MKKVNTQNDDAHKRGEKHKIKSGTPVSTLAQNKWVSAHN